MASGLLRLSIAHSLTSRRLVSRCAKALSHHAPTAAVTRHLDPTIQGFVKSLSNKQPCFNVPTRSIRILHQPNEFYQCLLDMIQRAEKHIFLSSLYIGSKEGELVDALYRSLRTKPHIQIHLLLDYNRSTRPGSDSTARILLPLLGEFPDRIRVSLFRSPKLKGLMAKLVPPRFNEGWGTWHPKIYGVDEEVMLSGANLNESYFSNRQDRYIHLNYPTLATYCRDFLQTSSAFAFRLLPSTADSEGYRTQWEQSGVHPHRIEAFAQETLSNFQSRWQLQSMKASQTGHGNVSEDSFQNALVMPIVQAGQFRIREEELALSLLFKELDLQPGERTLEARFLNGPLIDLTSGYFGLYDDYCKLILRSPISCRVIAASPKANGFYGSKGVSGRIPEGYTLLEQRFMREVRQYGQARSREEAFRLEGPGVQLNEWERGGWTYHAKGIWLRPHPAADPCLTLFGSTNLNSRSANLDTELSFFLATPCPDLRRRLAAEVDGLRAHALPWRGADRRVRLGTKALVALVGGML